MLTMLLIISTSLMPIFTYAAHSTVVRLTEAELNELLQYLFNQLAGSNMIPFSLLQELGLHTVSVISYLQSIGYYIIY